MRIELLLAPGCPHADAARREAQAALQHLGLVVAITEYVGLRPSPTLLVDGLDVVTGQPPARGACCRLDRPTMAQVVAAVERAR